MTDRRPKNVLIIAHGHPDLQKGGAEMAAMHLHRALRAEGIRSTFLARSGATSHGGSNFSSRNGDDELLVHTSMIDGFDFRGANPWNPDLLGIQLPGFLRRLDPDVIHFQHYVQLGLEWIHVARKTCPKARIVLTLHEYLALCHADGQMVKRPGLELCYRSDPDDCHRCFPEIGPADFFLRKEYFRSAFACVDRFISPSEFLRDRYVAWGIPAEKIDVIENLHPPYERQPPRTLAEGELRGRFAYFGQASPYKGLDVAIEAIARLPKEWKKKIHLDIHAANIANLRADVRQRVDALLADCGKSVTFRGTYEPRELAQRMAQADWVLVPSIWWENSPMVIQEALGHGRPVVCADIGGMAEKVRHGVDGWHFPARNAIALSETMRDLAGHSERWETLFARTNGAESRSALLNAHLRSMVGHA